LHEAFSHALSCKFLCQKQYSNKVLPFAARGSGNYAFEAFTDRFLLQTGSVQQAICAVSRRRPQDLDNRVIPKNHCVGVGVKPVEKTAKTRTKLNSISVCCASNN